MVASAESSLADLMHPARAFILSALERDAVALRPKRPRIRAPITPLAQVIFRILIFCFENVATGLCNPAIATIARTVGCAESSVKLLLPALSRTGYLTWTRGKRKRMRTRAGWRVVRSSNRYRITCPHRHLAALRRALIKATGGRGGPLIQEVVARVTPPSEEAKATATLVDALAADLRPSAARTAQTAPQRDTDPPSQAPPVPTERMEISGTKVDDPMLGNALARLSAALEASERREQGGSAKS